MSKKIAMNLFSKVTKCIHNNLKGLPKNKFAEIYLTLIHMQAIHFINMIPLGSLEEKILAAEEIHRMIKEVIIKADEKRNETIGNEI